MTIIIEIIYFKIIVPSKLWEIFWAISQDRVTVVVAFRTAQTAHVCFRVI